MKSTKLLLITSEFPPQPGGIGNHAWHLAKSFQQNAYEVSVLTDQRSEEGEEEELFDQQQSFQVYRIQRKKLIYFSYIKRLQQSFALAHQHDLVILSGKFSLWIGGLLSLYIRNKYIAIIHGSEVVLPNKTARGFTNYCLQRFDRVIAVSNYTKSLVADLRIKRIDVIPNGFAIHQAEKEIHFPSENLQLITVGNVTQRKGQQNVIKALPNLLKKYPDLHYHIVGIPTEKKKLVKLANDLGVVDKISFYGKVSEEKKLQLLQQSSIFIMLSEETSSGDVEGFGIAILEANSLSLPAIGAKGCGIEDAVEDQFSGLLIHPKDEAALQVAVDNILQNYSVYSENAEEWASRFTWDKIIKQYLQILEK